MASKDDDWVIDPPAAPADDWAITMPGTTTTEPPKSWAEVGDYYQKLARLAGNSLTFGMGDRARAVGQNLWGEGATSYEDALKQQVARTQAIRDEDPVRAVVGDITGGVVGALPTLGMGGVLPVGRAIAQPLLRRSLAAGAEGAVLGAAQGAGNTYTGNPMDYVKNAAGGAALGGVLGLPAPAVGSVASSVWKGIDKFGIPSPLARAAQTDAAGLQALPGRGPRAMLPDAGPSMQGVAQGAVIGGEGPGRAALIQALTERNRTVPQTITREVDQIFGPAQTPSVVEEGVRGRMRAIGPEYDTLLNGPNVRAIDNSSLANRLEALAINERGETQQVIRRVRSMLDIPTNPGHLDPHPRALHATREEVRGMMNDPKLNDTARGRLRQIYGELTDEIQRKVPGIRELDSRYAELGRQEEAVTTTSPGSRMFEKGRTAVTRPDELADTLREAAQPKGVNIGPSAEPVRMREAARAELDRIIGTNKNDLLALENLLGRPQDWNAQKLGVMFGRERADRLLNVLDSERVFRDTFGKVVEGSQTAQRTASKEALDASTGKIPVETGLVGLLLRGGQAAWNAARQGTAAGSRDRIAQILATNNPQQALIDRLLAAEPNRERRAEIVRNLVQSGWTGGGAGLVPGVVGR